MKNIITHIILINLAAISCGELAGIKLDNVEYEIWTYYEAEDKKNLAHVDYYDSNKRLLRKWGFGEYCNNYIYDKEGRLIEIEETRNCLDPVRREIFQFDSMGNQISSIKLQNNQIDLDTVLIRQTKFYDQHAFPIKQIEQQGSTVKLIAYKYKDEKLYSESVFNESGDLEWVKTFGYNDAGLIDSTYKQIGAAKEIERYYYDSQQRVIRRTISNNQKRIFKSPELPNNSKSIFDNFNHETIYEYKEGGELEIETKLSSEGKPFSRIIKRKKYASK